MGKYQIMIKLLSDLCVSDGGIYNSSIDTDVCYDDYGLPYIPAKRLKGCIRESAQELLDWGEDMPVDEIFGAAGKQRAAVRIRNGYLQNYSRYVEEITANRGSILCHPQNILQNFTYIRKQTEIENETGTAAAQSLRTMRVVNKDLVFVAEVEITAEAEREKKLKEKLENCLAVLKHMGVARTRGLGEVSLSLNPYVPDKEEKLKCKIGSVPYKANSNYLEYEITLDAPMICKSVAGQEENSMDYIEGAKILGHLGSLFGRAGEKEFLELLQSDSFICSNAYLSVNGKRFTEVPATVFSIKNNDLDYRNRLFLSNEEQIDENTGESKADKGLQLNQMKHCYVHIAADGQLSKQNVEMEERYHHRRPEDKAIGRVIEREGVDGGKFYQISSIRAGQTFKGYIQGTCDQIETVYNYISLNPEISLGYGRNSEYGKCFMRVSGIEQMEPAGKNAKSGKQFYVLLKAPTIIYSDKAAYSTSAEDLIAEIAANIGIDKSILGKQVKRYINITSVGGFNVTWGFRKPTIKAFDKGTVLQFTTTSDVQVPIGTIWLGERCMEGYGEAEIALIDENGKYSGVITMEDNGDAAGKEVDLERLELLPDIANRLFKDYLGYVAAVKVSESYKTNVNEELLRPTVSNMLLMHKEAKNLGELEHFCRERYAKKAGTKEEKEKQAEEIIGHVKEMRQLEERFGRDYHVKGFQYKGDVEMEYLKQYLIQIKYRLRTLKGLKQKRTVREEGGEI